MAQYRLVDPTTHEVAPGHFTCEGCCPKCKVLWSERADLSCDCFSPDSQDDKRQQQQMYMRRTVMDVIKLLSS